MSDQRDYYSVRIEWSDEDDAFVAVCPELENLPSFGDSPEEAIRNLREAIGLVTEVMIEDRTELPAPRKLRQFSGQFRIRITRSLHASLVDQAEREGVSLNSLVASYLAGAVAKYDSATLADYQWSNFSIQPIYRGLVGTNSVILGGESSVLLFEAHSSESKRQLGEQPESGARAWPVCRPS